MPDLSDAKELGRPRTVGPTEHGRLCIWGAYVSPGPSLTNPGGGPQENQFVWEDSDRDRMLLESKMTEDIDELLDPGGLSDI